MIEKSFVLKKFKKPITTGTVACFVGLSKQTSLYATKTSISKKRFIQKVSDFFCMKHITQ